MRFFKFTCFFLSVFFLACGGNFQFQVFEEEFLDITELKKEHLKARHIFFPKGVLTTYGRGLRIEGETVFFEDTVIETFPENQTAELGFKGRDGAVLTIVAGRIRGKLHVVLRGENGGEGLKARDLELFEGRGRRGRKGRSVKERCSPVVDHCYCPGLRHGENGGEGAEGREGKKGFSGGATGTLRVFAKETEGFELSYEFVRGEGGKGGLGGLGGVGGESGEGDRTHLCHAYAGKKGLRGKRGKRGEKGESGEYGKVCVLFGSKKELPCL